MKYLNGNTIKNLRMTHFNMGSGSNNIALVQYMVTFKLPDIFGVSETPLTQEIIDWVNTTDYNIETKDDNSRVWVLTKCSVVYKRRHDLEPPHLPVIWLELGSGKETVLVCNVYREWKSPSHPTLKSDSIPDQLARWNLFLDGWETAAQLDQEVHVLGDMNLNANYWLQTQVHDLTQRQAQNRPVRYYLQPLVDALFLRIMS